MDSLIPEITLTRLVFAFVPVTVVLGLLLRYSLGGPIERDGHSTIRLRYDERSGSRTFAAPITDNSPSWFSARCEISTMPSPSTMSLPIA